MVQAAYDSEDSIDAWTLTPEDHVRIAGKSRANRLAFAVLLLLGDGCRCRSKGGLVTGSRSGA